MSRIVRLPLFMLAIAFAYPASTGPRAATFDLDTGTPALFTGQGIPFDQTSGGITAHFSSPQGLAFSIQTDGSTGFHLSQFSGHYIYDNNLNRNNLDVNFSQHVYSVTLTFATADFQQIEIPTTIQLTAYDTALGTTVGVATAHGTYGSDTMPMGTLTYNSGSVPFDKIDLVLPYQPLGSTDFLVDNIVVSTTQGTPSGAVPDGTRVPAAPLTIKKASGGNITLSWSASCLTTDTDYEIYQGTIGNFTSHVPFLCTTSGAKTKTITPGSGNRYFLVVPRNGTKEGSYGLNGLGAEIPPSATACLPQLIGTCP
jgi:hypothetical protein